MKHLFLGFRPAEARYEIPDTITKNLYILP